VSGQDVSSCLPTRLELAEWAEFVFAVSQLHVYIYPPPATHLVESNNIETSCSPRLELVFFRLLIKSLICGTTDRPNLLNCKCMVGPGMTRQVSEYWVLKHCKEKSDLYNRPALKIHQTWKKCSSWWDTEGAGPRVPLLYSNLVPASSLRGSGSSGHQLLLLQSPQFLWVKQLKNVMKMNKIKVSCKRSKEM